MPGNSAVMESNLVCQQRLLLGGLPPPRGGFRSECLQPAHQISFDEVLAELASLAIRESFESGLFPTWRADRNVCANLVPLDKVSSIYLRLGSCGLIGGSSCGNHASGGAKVAVPTLSTPLAQPSEPSTSRPTRMKSWDAAQSRSFSIVSTLRSRKRNFTASCVGRYFGKRSRAIVRRR